MTIPLTKRERLRRTLPWALAVLFSVLALFSVVGRILTAQIEGEEAAIGAALGRATGFEVSIGAVNGRFLGWHPVLEAEEVTLSPPGAPPALRIGRMRAELDVLETLLRLRPVAANLVVEDLRVDLAAVPGGGWQLRNGSGGAPPDAEPIVHFLYHSDYVDLRRATVSLWGGDGSAVTEQISIDGGLVNEAFVHRGHLGVRLGVGATPVDAAADAAGASGDLFLELSGYPLDARTRAGELLLDVRDVDPESIAGRLVGGLPMASGVLDRLRLRARFDPRDGIDLVARASALTLDLGSADPVPVRNALVELEGVGLDAQHGDLVLRQLQARVGGEALDLDGLKVAWRSAGDGAPAQGRDWYLSMAEFDAEPVVGLMLTLDLLGERGARWLANLDPSAQVTQARVHVHEASRAVAAAVRVRDLGLRGYRGVPTIRGADAQAVVFERGGWVDLDSGPFYLRFPDVFSEGSRYDRGKGRINFRFDGSTLHLLSDRLDIEGPMGRASGHFALYLPEDRAERSISLALGIEDADAAYTEAYLPQKLSPGLRDWLVAAVRAGKVSKGAVLINGELLPSVPRARTTALWFDVDDARLAFDPRWPTASSVSARIVAEVDGVRGRITTARLGGLEAGETQLRVTLAGDRVGELLLSGQGRGDGDALLEFLRAAPLGDAVGFLDAGWETSGPVDLTFDLALPLDGSPPRRVEVGADLALSELMIPQGRLSLTDVEGRLAYRFPGTLAAERLTGRLFEGPVSATLSGSMDAAGDGLVVALEGQLRGSALSRWMNVDALSRLRGEAAYAGRLRLAADGAVALDVHTVGEVRMDTGLPAPLDAPDAPLSVTMRAGRDAPLDVGLEWGRLTGRFLLEDGELARGALALDEALGELPEAGLRARGRVRDLEVGAWLAAIERMGEDAVIRGGPQRSANAPLLDFDLAVDDASWGGSHFGAAQVVLAGSTREFEVGFDAERIAGRVRMGAGDAPMVLDLTRLALPLDPLAAATEPAREDPEVPGASVVEALTADLDTARMPDVDVVIRAFSNRDEDLGRAAFKLRPDPDGLRLEEIDAAGRGLTFGPDDEGRATIDLRLVPVAETTVVGRLAGRDAEATLERWGFAPTVDSDEFAFDLDLAWPGPLDVPDLQTVSGTVGLHVERGRFIEIDAGSGPLRVAGLFNFGSLARRLRLDFSDIYRKGVAFEDIFGVLEFDEGQLRTRDPVTIEGPSSRFALSGAMDLQTRTLDGELVVTLPVSSALPWYAAYAALVANPLAGAGVLVAERIFRDQIERYSSARYQISGSVEQPELIFDEIFQNQITPDGDVPDGDVPDGDVPEGDGAEGDASRPSTPAPKSEEPE
ncbi:MAG TPA: AsmA-like C-terminal region-containing protein [Pseudomonadales bacterium]|nr:AsmA-like C-terminal region-containing protein [Pseudomonadales bacterium]